MAWSFFVAVIIGWTVAANAQQNVTSVPEVGSCPADKAGCQSVDQNVFIFPASGTSAQELYIGGIFPVHDRGIEPFSCGMINVESFQEMMAFQWAVQTSDKRLVGAIPVANKGSVVFDTCGTDYSATQSILGLETCKSKPNHVGVSTPDSISTSERHVVDRQKILGFVNAVDSRNGQMETEASHIMLGLQKPVINTGTYSADFASNKPGARFNFVTPTIKQEIEASTEIIRKSVFAEEIFAMVVYSSDESSTNAYNEFKIAASAKNICIVFESRLDTPLQESQLEDAASGILMNQNARFVLTLLPESACQELYSRILGKTNNVFNLTFVFPPFTEKASNIVLKSSVHALGAVQLRHAPGPRFEDFRQFYRNLDEKAFPTVPLFAEFWQQRFQCNLQGQNGNNALRYRKFCNNLTLSLRNDDITSRIGYVITAVDALLMSIKEICPRGDICQSLNQTMFDQAIPKIVKRGEKVFDAKTGGPTSFQFDIFNLQKMEKEDQYVQVGTVKQDAQISYLKGFSIMAYQRHRGSGNDEVVQTKPTSLCNPRSCEACRAPPPVVTTVPPPNTTVTDDMERILGSYGPLRTHRIAKNAYVTGIFFRQFREDRQYTSRLYASDYRSIWSIALAVLAGLGIIAVILLEISLIYLILTYKFEGPEGKRRSHLNLRSLWLGQLLLFGIFLSYLTLFAYLPVPTKASCGITRFGIGISYAIIFSCLLVKLMVILHTRNTANYIPGEVNSSFQHSIGYMVSIFLIAFSVQLIIAIHWLIQVPPEAVLVRDNAGDLVWICNHYTWSLQHGFWEMPMFFRTEFENHILSLIYIMFLILLTFFFALKAFHIVVNMRESRFIALATGISILIFIAWGLIGGLLRNHEKSHEIGDGCIGFGLFFTSTVILFALFLPKVRQLVVIGMEGVFLEDDKETTYASSIYSPASVISPSGHRSMSGYAEGSVIGMHPMDRSVHVVSDAHNFSSDDMSRPIITVDTSFMSPDPPFIYDPHALQLKHPRSSGPSLYSVRSTPNLYDPPDVYSTRGTKLTRNFTGRSYMNETFSGSEYPSLYRPKSETHLYKHPRSEIGSL